MVIWLPPSQAVSTETWTPFIIALPTAPWRSPLFSPTHYVHLKLASWWSPLINPRGIICVAAYVNGALENHTREIHWEWCATRVVLTTKGIKVPVHLQWPSHDQQIQRSGVIWGVCCTFLALADHSKAKPNNQRASFCPKAQKHNQPHVADPAWLLLAL